MKKLLLSLVALLATVGAWAEVTPLKVSTDTQKYYYVIKNFRSHKFAYYNGDMSDLKLKVAPDANENVNNYIWYLTSDGDNYKLHSLGTDMTYAAVNSFTPTGTTVYVKENPYKMGYVVISKNETVTTSKSCWDDQDRSSEVGKIGWYAPTENDYEGTSWTFIEVTDTEEYNYTLTDEAGNSFVGTYDCIVFNDQKSLPRTKNIPLDNVEWTDNSVSATVKFPFPVSSSKITNPTLIANGASWNEPNSRKWRAVEVESINYVKVQTNVINQTNIDALWAIYPTLLEDRFTVKIKNLKTGTYVKANPDAVGNAGNGSDVTGVTKPVTLTEEGTDFEYKLRSGNNYHFTYLNNSKTELRLSMNSNTDSDVFLGVYNGTHSGNDVTFPDYVTDMTFTFPFSVSSSRQENPTIISSFGTANYGTSHDYRWYADGVNIKNAKETPATNSNILSHLWLIYPTITDSEYKFIIKNMHTGTYIYSTSNSNSHDDGIVTLSETATEFTFDTDKFQLSTGKYLSNNSSTGSKGRVQTIGTWGEHDGCKLSFPTVSYDVPISDVGYSTLYSPIAVAIPEGVTAYAVTAEGINDNNVTLTEKTGGIAANEGVIIAGEKNTYTFTAAEVTSDWTDNLLEGSATNTYIKGSGYVLSASDGVAGLYKALLNKDDKGGNGNTHFLNNAGKAYLPATAVPSEARFLVFDFGTETAIESIEGENGNVKAEIYDLAGRRVQNAQKGLYIVNGKKVIK